MSLNFPNHFEDVMWCLSSLSESPILLNYFKIAWIKYFLECIESTRLMVHGNPLSLSYVIRGQFNQCVVWSLLEKRSNFSPSSCSVGPENKHKFWITLILWSWSDTAWKRAFRPNLSTPVLLFKLFYLFGPEINIYIFYPFQPTVPPSSEPILYRQMYK